MSPRSQRVISLFILSFPLFNLTNAALVLPSCELQNYHDVNSGLVSFFHYDASDTVSYRDIDFLSRGYLETEYFASEPAIYDITWDSGPDGSIPPYGWEASIDPFPVKNFLMTIMGFYFTTQSGIHKVNIEVTDLAGVALFMGTEDSFDCCAQMPDYTGAGTVYTNAVGQSNIPQDIYLEAGTSYPFTLVYVNNGGPGGLKMQVTLPDGSVDNTVADHLHGFFGNEPPACDAVTPTDVFPTLSATTNTGSTSILETSTINTVTTVTTGTSSDAVPETPTITTGTTGSISNTVPETTTVTTTTTDTSIATTTETITTTTATTDTIINTVPEITTVTTATTATTATSITTTATTDTDTVTTATTGTISNTLPKTTTVNTVTSENTDTSSDTVSETDIVTSDTIIPEAATATTGTTGTSSSDLPETTNTAITGTTDTSSTTIPETATVTTVTTNTISTTIPETATVTSYSGASLTEEATIISTATGTDVTITHSLNIPSSNSDDSMTIATINADSNTKRKTTTTTPYNSASISKSAFIAATTTDMEATTTPSLSSTITSVTSDIENGNSPDINTATETNPNGATSHTGGSITVETASTFAATGTNSITTYEINTATETFSSGDIPSHEWSSYSSSTMKYYNNSTYVLTSTCLTSHEVASPNTPKTSKQTAQPPVKSDAITTFSVTTTHNSPDNKPAPLVSSPTAPGNKPTFTGKNSYSSTTDAASLTTTQTHISNMAKPSDNMSSITLVPPENGHTVSAGGGDNKFSSATNEGSFKNINDDRDMNSNGGTSTAGNPYTPSTVTISTSLSTYRGVGAVNKEWSLKPLLVIAILAIV